MAEGVNVRLPGKLKKFIAEQSGPDGVYENASEYVRDLIRKDYQHHEELKWVALKERLSHGMKAGVDDFVSFVPEEIIQEAKKQKAVK
jgi:putative addiction module CopG family antidote